MYDVSLRVNDDFHKSKRAFIVDNFYNDPYAVRDFALNQQYEKHSIDNPYVGSRTFNQFIFPGIKEAFEEIIGEKITAWGDVYGMCGRFQYNVAGQPLVYHCDAQRWAGMIYLTPDAPPECGTSTYMHKKTRIFHNEQIDWDAGQGLLVFNQKTFVDRTPYERVDAFGNIFNRLVIFNGGCIHGASEYFGSDIQDGRLWHMFFFDT
jgi:hypothetical protein